MGAANGPLRRHLERNLGISGLLVAFVTVDAVATAIVFSLLSLTWLGIAISVVSLGLAIVGYRAASSSRLRLSLLAVLVFLLLLLPQALLIAEQPPFAAVIDGVLLNDAAADRLSKGENPYQRDYLDTRMRAFYLSDVPVNFGLSRYVYMPGMMLLDVPVRLASGGRANFSWLFLLGLPALAAAAVSVGRTALEREAALISVTLSPLFLADYFYLLNDLFFLSAALAAVGMIRRRRFIAAGLLAGVSLDLKQQAVLFLPLLAIYAIRHLRAAEMLRLGISAAAAVTVVVVPFLAWDPRAFLAGTLGFFYGSGVDSYPIRGVGLQGLLLRAGLIQNRWAAFPGALIQVPVMVLTIAVAARRLWRRWTWTGYWGWTGVMAAVAFFLGRVLSPNYLDLVLILLTLALTSALVNSAPGTAIGGEVDGPAGDRGEVGAPVLDNPRHLPAT